MKHCVHLFCRIKFNTFILLFVQLTLASSRLCKAFSSLPVILMFIIIMGEWKCFFSKTKGSKTLGLKELGLGSLYVPYESRDLNFAVFPVTLKQNLSL